MVAIPTVGRSEAAFWLANELLMNPEAFEMTPERLKLLRVELTRVRNREARLVALISELQRRAGGEI